MLSFFPQVIPERKVEEVTTETTKMKEVSTDKVKVEKVTTEEVLLQPDDKKTGGGKEGVRVSGSLNDVGLIDGGDDCDTNPNAFKSCDRHFCIDCPLQSVHECPCDLVRSCHLVRQPAAEEYAARKLVQRYGSGKHRDKPFPKVIPERKALFGQSMGDCVPPDGGRNGDSEDPPALQHHDKLLSKEANEERRLQQTSTMELLRAGVESNPGPVNEKNLAEAKGWQDEKCVGRSEGKVGAGVGSWYFNMENEEKRSEPAVQKGEAAEAKGKWATAPLAVQEDFDNVGDEAQGEKYEAELGRRRHDSSETITEDNWTNQGIFGMLEGAQKAGEEAKLRKKKKEEEEEKMRKYWKGVKLDKKKGQKESEETCKEESQNKGRKIEKPPPAPRQTEFTVEPLPRVTQLLLMYNAYSGCIYLKKSYIEGSRQKHC